MTPRLWDVNTAAGYLGVSTKFVRRHARELGAFKVGAFLRFDPDQIAGYLEQRRLDRRRAG